MTAGGAVIGPAARADAGAFLSRLVRFDPAAVVRLRPARPADGWADYPGAVQMWAMLPFGVMVMRALGEVRLDQDATVEAGALLRTLDEFAAPLPPRCDSAWRWALPPSRGRAVEVLPAREVVRVAAAASQTLRAASTRGVGGRMVGQRAVRDALLDHVPIVVTGADGERVDVSQRLVQATVRMGFVGSPAAEAVESVTFGDTLITVRRSATWIGLEASYGSSWYRPISRLGLA